MCSSVCSKCSVSVMTDWLKLMPKGSIICRFLSASEKWLVKLLQCMLTEGRQILQVKASLLYKGRAQCGSHSRLSQSIVVLGNELQGISSTTAYQSLKLLVASTCDLPGVINCQFREFATAPLGPMYFLSPDQESGIHCLIICRIQLLTPNNLGEAWRRICLLDIQRKH